MKQLIIIGARAYGREVYSIALESVGYNEEFVVKGYLDDKEDALNDFIGYPPILGPVETYQVQPQDVFICALGNVIYKEKYVNIIKGKGGKFINLVHKSVEIPKNFQIGEGCIICRDAILSCDLKIGNFDTIQSLVILGHDVVIGDFCQINSFSFMGGFVKIGNYVTINPNSTIIPHIKIHNNATIGAGSVVIKDVKQGISVFGNPAKKIEL